jgi:hypothetical protein
MMYLLIGFLIVRSKTVLYVIGALLVVCVLALIVRGVILSKKKAVCRKGIDVRFAGFMFLLAVISFNRSLFWLAGVAMLLSLVSAAVEVSLFKTRA